MYTTKIFLVFLAVSLFLAACGAAERVEKSSGIYPLYGSGTQAVDQEDSRGVSGGWLGQAAREDTQGAVTMVVTPLNLDTPGETIDFEVSLDTHSVDLSMDLAALSTLLTDTGLSVNGLLWDGERGGHHVKGTLSFPASKNNIPLLKDATEVSLVIRNLDAAERTFFWAK